MTLKRATRKAATGSKSIVKKRPVGSRTTGRSLKRATRKSATGSKSIVKKRPVGSKSTGGSLKNPQLLVINPTAADRKAARSEALAAFREFHGCDPSDVIKIGKGSEPLIALGQVHTIIYGPRIGVRASGLYRHKFRAGSATLVTDLDGRLSILPRGKKPYRVDFKRGIIG